MKTAHTRGPWFNGCHGGGEIQILADDTGTPNERTDDISNSWVLATVNDCMGSESEANANLITAAPELFEAVKGLLGVVDEVLPQAGGLVLNIGRLNETLILARRAIKDATEGRPRGD